MDGIHLAILLVILNIFRSSHCIRDYGAVRMCNGDFETLGRCFVPVNQSLDWHAADKHCQNSLPPTPHTPPGIERYGHLAAVEDVDSQGLLAAEAAALGWDATWINGRLKERIWFWQKDGGVLAYQGCWLDDPSNPDLPIPLTVSASTKPSDCLAMCKERADADDNHEFYVLGIQKDAQGNLVCHCGADWNQKHGRSYSRSCDGVCPGADITTTGNKIDKYCGGDGHQLIYYTNGELYQMFAPTSVRRYRHCIVMNHDYNYQWWEDNCHDLKPFICHYDISEYDCNLLRGYHWANGACITIEMESRTFYDAQAFCAEHGAYLLKVVNSDVHEAVKGLLPFNKFYIALTDEQWIFSYGKLVFRYFNWGRGQPAQGPGQDCFMMNAKDNFKWYNIDCHTPLPFMCMVDIRKEEKTTMVSQEFLNGIGVGAGGAVVIVVVILLCACGCLRHRRHRKHERQRQREGRNQNSANQALPSPPPNQRSRGAPVSNPSYEPDNLPGHYAKGRRGPGTFNDPNYMETSRDGDSLHEYANLERKNYNYLKPTHSKRKY